jgi:uncharacterized protein (UPF0335 family)
MATLNEFKELIRKQQAAVTTDPNYPLNRLVREKKPIVYGPKMSPEEVAELQHDLAEFYSADRDSIPRGFDIKNVSEEAKQREMNRQRQLIAEIRRNSAEPNNGRRDPRKQQLSREEREIMNLARRAGFDVSENTGSVDYLNRNARGQKQDDATGNQRSGLQGRSLIEALQRPPNGEDLEITEM